ncbi:MAG: type II secretion system F family protein [Deltaproteobacteria bacterium]|nr:type II secretion system F family protein [Deltaproteobacteria bacterium]
MTTFSYRARDLNGLLITGTYDGEAPESVRGWLSEQGLIPIAVKKGSAVLSGNFFSDLFKRVKDQELMLFTRQFHTLFKAGMDMETILTTLGNQTRNKYFSEALIRIRTDVAGGSNLSRAFAQHPKIFPGLYTNMLATGEEAGILDEVLAQLAILIEKDITLKTSVKSATLYPKIVIVVLIGATFVIMTKVIPELTKFYGHYKSELPPLTKALVAVSYFFRDYTHVALAIMAGIVFAFRRWRSTTRGGLIVDKLKWRIPVFGPLGIMVANARFANILGSLYKAGITVSRALSITALTIGNAAFTREIETVRGEVDKGKGIAEAMRQTKYLSPLLIETTAIGERSGSLDELYFSIGSHFDMEVSHTLKNLTTLLEPMLLVVIFSMVAFFMLAIFLPIMNISSVVLH